MQNNLLLLSFLKQKNYHKAIGIMSINTDEYIDYKFFINAMWRLKYLLIIMCCCAILFSVVYLFFSVDEYKISATIMPLQGQRNFTVPFFEKAFEIKEFETLLSANLPAYFQDLNTMYLCSVMESRDFTIRLVEKNNLLPVIYSEIWDQSQNKWTCNHNTKSQSAFRAFIYRVFGKPNIVCPPTALQGAEYLLNKMLFVKNPRQTMFIRIELVHPSQKFAYKILNIFLQELDRYLREKEFMRADANIRYLNEIIQAAKSEEIRKGLLRVRNSQLLIKKYSKGINDFAFQIIDPPIQIDKPFKPRRKLIFFMSLAISICLWLMIIYFSVMINFFNKE